MNFANSRIPALVCNL